MVKSSTVEVTATKQPTVLTAEITPGSGPPLPQTIAGKLTDSSNNPLSGKRIELWVNGSYKSYMNTAPDGSYGFYNIAVSEGNYVFDVIFPGDDSYKGATKSITASFKKGSSVFINWGVSPREGVLPLTVKISGTLARQDTLQGLGGRDVKIYKEGSLFKTVKTSTDPATLGYFETTDTLTKAGVYSYYAEWPGDQYFTGCEEYRFFYGDEYEREEAW